MTRQIFRKEALERLSSPEQLDQLMPVTDTRGWIALAGIGLLIVVAILWSIFGKIATTVEGHGVLTRREGVELVRSSHAGVVAEVCVAVGETVTPGQKLVCLNSGYSFGANPMQVVSAESGRILDIAVAEGDVVEERSALLTMESLGHPLQAVLYYPASDGYQIEAGMEVDVFPATEKRRESRHLSGRVGSVGKLPVTRAAMMRSLKSAEWAESFLRLGPALEVVVELTTEDSLMEVYSGTPCRARIIVDRQPPIQFVLPVGGR